MMRFALVLGAAAALYKVAQARRPSPALPSDPEWVPKARPEPVAPVAVAPVATPTPEPEPTSVQPVEADAADDVEEAAPKDGAAAWVEPDGGACPVSHPVKAKLSSSIFHLPGMTAYDRTNADRCYRDEATAEADGLRRAKR